MPQRRYARQPSDTFSGPIVEARAVSTAGGGTALTNAATVIAFPNRTEHAEVLARAFAGGAIVVKWAVNPYLAILKTTDFGVSFTEYSLTGQDNPADTTTGVTLNSLDTLANGDALLLGANVPFRGFRATMVNTNSNASVMTCEFWNGSAWVAVSGFSDGTVSGGTTTFGQTGNVTFTLPTTWQADFLNNTMVQGFIPPNVRNEQRRQWQEHSDTPLYWLRVTVSAALDSTTLASPVLALNRSTSYAEMLENSVESFRVFKGIGGNSCVELLTDQGTASAIVNVYADNPKGSF